MYAQIDFNRESDENVYTRMRLFNDAGARTYNGDIVLGQNGGMSMKTLFQELSIELNNLVSQSIISQDTAEKLSYAYAEIFLVHGWNSRIVWPADQKASYTREELRSFVVFDVSDPDDLADLPLAGRFVKQLTVDVQI